MSKQKQIVYTICSELVVFMYRTGKSMNNLLSCCELVDASISASKKIFLYLNSKTFWVETILKHVQVQSIKKIVTKKSKAQKRYFLVGFQGMNTRSSAYDYNILIESDTYFLRVEIGF